MLNNNRIIYIATVVAGIRKSIDGLAILIQESFRLGPL